ncbi:MAG TPA: C1 family peptidase [Bryobacteraceae bacterium]|jgi:C1A family cysteine protease|nr:C1 family peptidase [Bryobacteraceae bacterium]
MPINRKYGWAPDLPDHRDHLYSAPQPVLAKLPPKKDLRSGCPPIYDQGQIGSCTANAISAAVQFEQKKQALHVFMPSRLFVYYNERSMEKTVNSDAGAQIRDGVKSLANLGVCPETEWPYDVNKFADKPTPTCYTAAKKCEAVGYQRLDSTNLNQLKGCIATGFPFVFGFTVYDAFESQEVAKTGVLNLPGPKEKVQGGHAVLAVGYDDSTQRFTVRNSWGKDWGTRGYFTIPYSYLTSTNLADDFWTIRILKET